MHPNLFLNLMKNNFKKPDHNEYLKAFIATFFIISSTFFMNILGLGSLSLLVPLMSLFIIIIAKKALPAPIQKSITIASLYLMTITLMAYLSHLSLPWTIILTMLIAISSGLIIAFKNKASILLGALSLLFFISFNQDLPEAFKDPAHIVFFFLIAGLWSYLTLLVSSSIIRKGKEKETLFVDNKKINFKETIVSNLSFQSPFFIHGMRLAITLAITTLIVGFSSLSDGLWLMITIIVVSGFDLDPRETLKAGITRTVGTIIGVFLAFFLFEAYEFLVLDYVKLIVFALLTFLTILSQKINPILSATFLTIFIIFTILMTSGVSAGQTAIIERAALTLIGALIAILSRLILWPKK